MAVPPPSRPDPMNKAALRTRLRATRAAFVSHMHPDDIARHAMAVAARLIPILQTARCVGGYAPLGNEFPILPALEQAASRGIATALPHVTHRDRPMDFRTWTPGTVLEKGCFGLPQPDTGLPIVPDVILTPLLGFDRALQRIGQGAGFYDRWLSAHPASICVGIAWSVQEVPQIPVDAWDMPLHAIVTEKEWIGPSS
ncbi:5-formyltetrahydrofolate cyclo-ligase [Sphingobium boeckii]|uniref:5-formyltetrahydrofolate cyclo-ligase n=1 Tax=Sphingobium boeckii TaxID=1082345 RepID=A0A7W9EEL7_9SPHN|nr:5-formyltetrahydrofolate cyclo-ligase [Sphingobium boeckii]MBB5685130.1 5-formyltetrahydrofolate cyclo-ligase [Sphingobium boeckii]